ncbi:hypothetical protein [Paenibacillus sp. 1A_MP2]|uniref:hypothetical protein n=1 Tax=Paenibacillus sp. 1A_MP2 TaxID=3457495 RepID=UPI003FCD849A
MLMLTDWGTSNFNEVHTYIIRSGVLQPIKFTDNKGKKISDAYWALRNNGIRSLSGFRVQFKYYNNLQFKYVVDTFKLNLSKLELRLNDTRYLDQSSWPNSGMGIVLIWRVLRPLHQRACYQVDLTSGLE